MSILNGTIRRKTLFGRLIALLAVLCLLMSSCSAEPAPKQEPNLFQAAVSIENNRFAPKIAGFWADREDVLEACERSGGTIVENLRGYEDAITREVVIDGLTYKEVIDFHENQLVAVCYMLQLDSGEEIDEIRQRLIEEAAAFMPKDLLMSPDRNDDWRDETGNRVSLTVFREARPSIHLYISQGFPAPLFKINDTADCEDEGNLFGAAVSVKDGKFVPKAAEFLTTREEILEMCRRSGSAVLENPDGRENVISREIAVGDLTCQELFCFEMEQLVTVEYILQPDNQKEFEALGQRLVKDAEAFMPAELLRNADGIRAGAGHLTYWWDRIGTRVVFGSADAADSETPPAIYLQIVLMWSLRPRPEMPEDTSNSSIEDNSDPISLNKKV